MGDAEGSVALGRTRQKKFFKSAIHSEAELNEHDREFLIGEVVVPHGTSHSEHLLNLLLGLAWFRFRGRAQLQF